MKKIFKQLKTLASNVKLTTCYLLAVMLCGLPNYLMAADAIKVRAVTSSFAPLQMIQDGKPGGYAIDIVNVLVKKISSDSDQKIDLEFEFLPWNRGFRAATSDQPNILFFSLSRSPKREDLFHWVGEISPYDMHLFTLDSSVSDNPPTLQSIRESNKVVGVQDGSNVEEFLRLHGFVKDRDFLTYDDYHTGIKMLYRQRIDFIPMTSFLARGNVCGENQDADLLVKSLRLDSISRPLWMVFSKSTDPGLVKLFKHALESFNSGSEYRSIVESHITEWSERICKNRH